MTSWQGQNEFLTWPAILSKSLVPWAVSRRPLKGREKTKIKTWECGNITSTYTTWSKINTQNDQVFNNYFYMPHWSQYYYQDKPLINSPFLHISKNYPPSSTFKQRPIQNEIPFLCPLALNKNSVDELGHLQTYRLIKSLLQRLSQ